MREESDSVVAKTGIEELRHMKHECPFALLGYKPGFKAQWL
jgi:hypothetical protein